MKTVRSLATLLLIAAATPGCSQVQAPSGQCNWLKVLAPNEVRFPVQADTHAAYAIYAFQADPSVALRVEGSFPYAAFLSYTTYGAGGLLFDALVDDDITPDQGSVNPFVEGSLVNAARRSYRIHVVPGQASTANTLSMPPIPPGSASAAVTLVMRVYLPEPDHDRLGGVPLPTITAVAAGDLQTVKPCPAAPQATPDFGSLSGVSQAPSPRGGRIQFYRPPVSIVPFADGTGPLTVGDCTTYLMATLDAEKVAVVRLPRAPSFFDNTDTDASTRFRVTQVRYLSLGSYGASVIPRPGSDEPGNLAGPQVLTAGDGAATFVVIPDILPASTKAEIGAKAAASGFNVLPMAKRGPAAAPFLIYRNKLPAGNFEGNIANVPCYGDGATFDQAPESYAAAPDSMGPYAPQGVECSPSEFLQDACGQQAAR